MQQRINEFKNIFKENDSQTGYENEKSTHSETSESVFAIVGEVGRTSQILRIYKNEDEAYAYTDEMEQYFLKQKKGSTFDSIRVESAKLY